MDDLDWIIKQGDEWVGNDNALVYKSYDERVLYTDGDVLIGVPGYSKQEFMDRLKKTRAATPISDLDWLCLNEHDWRDKNLLACHYKGKVYYRALEYTSLFRDEVGANYAVNFYGYEAWIERRAELQNHPGWGHEYDAIQQGGNGCWYGNLDRDADPLPNFLGGTGWRCINDGGEVLGNHLNTLERRPEIDPEIVAVMPEDWSDLHLTDEPKQWTGHEDGLPPVGIDCEYVNHITQTVDYCSVIAEHDNGVVIAVHEDNHEYSYHQCANPNRFRPLRTEEDKAVEEMKHITMGCVSLSDICRKLYQENYRKIEREG